MLPRSAKLLSQLASPLGQPRPHFLELLVAGLEEGEGAAELEELVEEAGAGEEGAGAEEVGAGADVVGAGAEEVGAELKDEEGRGLQEEPEDWRLRLATASWPRAW